MKNGKEIRRAGGSETTKWSQPGSRFAALRGLRGVPKESAVPPSLVTNMVLINIFTYGGRCKPIKAT